MRRSISRGYAEETVSKAVISLPYSTAAAAVGEIPRTHALAHSPTLHLPLLPQPSSFRMTETAPESSDEAKIAVNVKGSFRCPSL